MGRSLFYHPLHLEEWTRTTTPRMASCLSAVMCRWSTYAPLGYPLDNACLDCSPLAPQDTKPCERSVRERLQGVLLQGGTMCMWCDTPGRHFRERTILWHFSVGSYCYLLPALHRARGLLGLVAPGITACTLVPASHSRAAICPTAARNLRCLSVRSLRDTDDRSATFLKQPTHETTPLSAKTTTHRTSFCPLRLHPPF